VLSGETVNPGRVMPKFIVLAVGVTTLTHLLVSVSVVRLMIWEELVSSRALIADTALRVWRAWLPRSKHIFFLSTRSSYAM
jgi:amino acid transporter